MESIYIVAIVAIVFALVLQQMHRLVHFAVISIVTPWMFLMSFILLQEAYPAQATYVGFSEGFALFIVYCKASLPAYCGTELWLFYIRRCFKEERERQRRKPKE